MGELSDLRPLAIDLFCFFGLHLGSENCRRRGFFGANYGPSPVRRRFLWTALVPQWTAETCRLRCLVSMRANTVFLIAYDTKSETFSSRTEVNIVLGIVGKRTADESATATVGIVFHRLPAILPRTIKVYARSCCSLHRRMVGIVAIGNDLLGSRPKVSLQRWRAGSNCR
jgi:hypothetical protein